MQNVSFSTLLANARAANSAEAIYASVKSANEKLQRNIRKAQFASFQTGYSAEAEHLFQNVIPAQQTAVNEINAIWTRAASGLSAEEIVHIMTEAV